MAKPAKHRLNRPNISVPTISVRGAIGLLADLLSIGSTLATVFGIKIYLSGSSSKLAISLDKASFAIRFILIVLIAAGLGWAYGSLSVRLTNTRKEYLHVISQILALVFAAILVAAAEMISDGASKGALPQVQFFTLMGLAIVMWLCRFQYRSHAQSVAPAVMNRRAIGLLVFAATTVFVLLLMELG